MTETGATPDDDRSPRFLAKRARILDAAAGIINARGLKGLTLVAAAEALGTNATSITYYFRRKEHLAAAALERAVARLDAMAAGAAEAPDPPARVRALLRVYLAETALIRDGEAAPFTRLSDIRALEEPWREAAIAAYRGLLRRVAGFFAPEGAPPAGTGDPAYAAAHVLMECIHWLNAWTPDYSAADFPRLEDRLCDLFAHGFAAPGRPFAPPPLALEPPQDSAQPGREAFLRAATLEINERGYRGASVERIAARLGVSKGSFYHHLDAKDDLVATCFARSYARATEAQRRAIEAGGPQADRLAACMAALLRLQFRSELPLLRSAALQALPPELRAQELRHAGRLARRFAGMLADGIADGSVRPVDPMIAAECLLAAINAASDARLWAEAQPDPETAAARYAAVLWSGLHGGA